MDGALRAQLSRLSPAASARASRQREYWAAASSPAPFFRTRVGWPGGVVGSTRRRNDAIPGFRGAVRSDGAAETTLDKRGLSLEQATPRLVFICETGWIGAADVLLSGRRDADSADFTHLCWRGDLPRLS